MTLVGWHLLALPSLWLSILSYLVKCHLRFILFLVFPQSFRYLLFLFDPRLCQLVLSTCSSDCDLLPIWLGHFAIDLEYFFCFFFKTLTSYPILFLLHNSARDLALDMSFCKLGKRLL